MCPFHEIDHTADIGLDIYSGTLPGLFHDAAEGMCSLCFESGYGSAIETELVDLQEAALDELLQNWLTELNYQSVTRASIPCAIAITEIAEQADGAWRLRSRIGWSKTEDYFSFLRTEIKAVTYHQLSVQNTGDSWTARVIFDI